MGKDIGKYYEEFTPGEIITHPRLLRVEWLPHAFFNLLTGNFQPLHWRGGHDGILVNGLYTLAISVAQTLPETTLGTLKANKGYDKVRHTRPVRIGNILTTSTLVQSTRESSYHQGAGIVTFLHTMSANEVPALTFLRTALILRKFNY